MSKRIAWITTGTVALLVGGSIAVGGGAINGIFGSDNSISSGTHHLHSTTSALVTEPGDFKNDATNDFGRPELSITVVNPAKAVFLGVGPTADVDRYLAGAAVETVNDADVSPFRLDTTVTPGNSKPAAPAGQSFWVATGDGTKPLDWAMPDGNYRIVLMNADGTSGIDTDARFALAVPHIHGIGLGLLGTGLVLALAGAAAITIGLRRHNDPPNDGTYAASWPAPANTRQDA